MISAGLVSTVKAPEEELIRFVNYHLNLGVNRIFLFFDDPHAPAISRLAADPRVACIRCDATHWAGVKESERESVIQRQIVNATRALQMAREQGIDWLLHIDSDELLHCPDGLKNVLAAAPPEKDTVIFRPWEAVPERLKEKNPFSSRFFRVLPWPRRRWPEVYRRAEQMGCRKYFLNGRYFRGHQVGKSAVRTSSDPYQINPHKPLFHDRQCRPYLRHNAVVLHFESNSFEHWINKMTRWLPLDWQDNPRATTLTSQLTKVAEIHDQGGPDVDARLKALYKQLYFIGFYGRVVLRTLGLLQKIKLDPALFDTHGE